MFEIINNVFTVLTTGTGYFLLLVFAFIVLDTTKMMIKALVEIAQNK